MSGVVQSIEENPLFKKLAHYKIESWKAHHRKLKRDLLRNLTMMIALEHNLGRGEAEEAAGCWIEAAEYHDKAEKYEDEGDLNEAEKYWELAKKSLADYYAVLSIKKSSV